MFGLPVFTRPQPSREPFGGGTLLPLALLLVGRNPALMLGAGMFLLQGNLIIRFVIIKIPHASA